MTNKVGWQGLGRLDSRRHSKANFSDGRKEAIEYVKGFKEKEISSAKDHPNHLLTL